MYCIHTLVVDCLHKLSFRCIPDIIINIPLFASFTGFRLNIVSLFSSLEKRLCPQN